MIAGNDKLQKAMDDLWELTEGLQKTVAIAVQYEESLPTHGELRKGDLEVDWELDEHCQLLANLRTPGQDGWLTVYAGYADNVYPKLWYYGCARLMKAYAGGAK